MNFCKFISYLKSSQIVILPIFYNELDFVDGFKGNLNNNNFFSFIVFNVELKKIEIVENKLIFKENINSTFIKNILNYFNVLFLNERINVNLTSWSCEYSEMDDHYSNICSDMSFFTLANLQRLQNLIQQKDEVKSILKITRVFQTLFQIIHILIILKKAKMIVILKSFAELDHLIIRK